MSFEKAALIGLPRELFDSIMSYLEDRADISSLSRTSKGIRSLTVQLVFENVTMLWTGNDEGDEEQIARAIRSAGYLRKQNPNVTEVSPGCECPRLDLLLRSILENPEYGHYVQRVDLQCVRYRRSAPLRMKPKLPSPPKTGKYHSLISAAIHQTGLDQSGMKEDLESGLRTNDFDMVISLLILLCPNITSLTLGVDIIVHNPTLRFIFKNYILPIELTGSISRLQHLKDVKIGTSFDGWLETWLVSWPRKNPDWTLDLQSYLPFFYLPKLERAELSLPAPQQTIRKTEFKWPVNSPSLSALRILRLPHSSLVPSDLQYILMHMPCITRLEYDFRLWSYNILDAKDLTSALACTKHTLKHVKIKHEHWSTEDPFIGQRGFGDDYEYIKGHCSLKDLVALETAAIPSSVLLGWFNHNCPGLAAVLPRNLITLCLTDDLSWFDTFQKGEDDLMPIFQRFVEGEDWKKAVPRLEAFNVGYQGWRREDQTVRLFEENGLSCRLIPVDEYRFF